MFDKVLQIGINYVGTPYELNGCVNDVKNLNEFLRKDLGADKAQFKILTEDGIKPTRKNIFDAIDWLLEGATDGTKLFIHYSGHGSWTRDLSGDEKDGRDEKICALDGDILDDELRTCLARKIPKGCELWGIFDSCFSGSILDLRYSYTIDIVGGRTGFHIYPDGHYKEYDGKICLFSGCTDQQTSADCFLDGNWTGALTWSFIKSCRSLMKRNHSIRYKELMKLLIMNLKKKNFTQLPQISTGKWTDLNEVMWQ